MLRRLVALLGLAVLAVVLAGVATAPAALVPAGARGGLLRVAPELPVVGARVTVELRLPGGDVPGKATLALVSPSGQHLKATLRRAAPGLLSGAVHFADDGLWKLAVRSGGIDAGTDVLVLQPGAIVPGPKSNLVPAQSGSGGLGLLGGR